eukprot:3728498-Amphidinium_carterae.2
MPLGLRRGGVWHQHAPGDNELKLRIKEEGDDASLNWTCPTELNLVYATSPPNLGLFEMRHHQHSSPEGPKGEAPNRFP